MALTREIIVTYGAYAISTATGRKLDGKVQSSRSHTTGTCEFSFYVFGATAVAFAAECVAAEAAFRIPHATFTVTQGGSTLIAASHAANTGFDADPEIVKAEDIGDTGNSRRYTVRLEYGLPANTGAEQQVGIREVAVDVSYEPSRRRIVTISGVVTAAGANSAREQYEDIIVALEADIFGAGDLDIASTARELVEEPSVRSDTENKLCEFSRKWEELVFSQAGSSFNDAGLVKQRLDISRRKEAPGDTPTAKRLATMDLSYEAWVDADDSTDLTGEYDAIRSWLITQIDTCLNGQDFALVEETPNFYYDENRISVSMTVQGQFEGETVIEQRVTVDDDDQEGWEILPCWTGDPLSAYWYAGPRIIVRTVTHSLKKIGTWNEKDALGFAKAEMNKAKNRAPAAGGGGQWLIIRQRPQATPLKMGLDTHTMDVSEMNVVTQMRRVKSPSGGGVTTVPTYRPLSPASG